LIIGAVRVYEVHKLSYTIDFPVLFLFGGVSLDIVSTLLFVALNAGREAHPILGELISVSIWFIPVYLFTTNAFFVPFLSGVLRRTLSYAIGLSGVLFSMNNFSLVLFRNAFLVDNIGYTPLIIIFVLLGFIIFFYYIKVEKLNPRDIVNNFLQLFFYVIFIGIVNVLFFLIAL